MKKIYFTALLLFLSGHILAKQVLLKQSNHFNEPQPWIIETKDDGMLFILGPQSKFSLLITVDSLLKNGQIPDRITVYCNNFIYHLLPQESVICRGNMNDMSSFNIAPTDFKNGSQGSYKFIPIKN